jgi:hypothetical protein
MTVPNPGPELQAQQMRPSESSSVQIVGVSRNVPHYMQPYNFAIFPQQQPAGTSTPPYNWENANQVHTNTYLHTQQMHSMQQMQIHQQMQQMQPQVIYYPYPMMQAGHYPGQFFQSPMPTMQAAQLPNLQHPHSYLLQQQQP